MCHNLDTDQYRERQRAGPSPHPVRPDVILRRACQSVDPLALARGTDPICAPPLKVAHCCYDRGSPQVTIREEIFVPLITIGVGVLLTLIGLGGYFLSGMSSWTALIPAFLGIPMALLGVLARQEAMLKHAMHGAAAVALLGFLGTVMGVVKFVRLIAGAEIARPEAVKVQALVAVICAVFLVLCVNSFIQTRRARAAS